MNKSGNAMLIYLLLFACSQATAIPPAVKPQRADAEQQSLRLNPPARTSLRLLPVSFRYPDSEREQRLGVRQVGEDSMEAIARHRRNARKSAARDEAAVKLGIELYRDGRIDEAIAQYRSLLATAQAPLPEAHFNLAIALAHKGDLISAVEHYQQAIAQRRDYPEAHNNLGLVYEAQGEPAAAAQEFQRALIARQGRYPLAHYNLARYYYGIARYDDAIAEFQLAIKQQQNFPEAYLNLGNLYLLPATLTDRAEPAQAIAAYRKAIELRNGYYPLAHENLAIALSLTGKRAQALKEYRIAFIQYDGASADMLENLISTLTGRNQFRIGNELSRDDIAGNIKNARREPDWQRQLGTALAHYQELDEKLKEQADVHFSAGIAYAALADWPQAIDELARAVALSSDQDREAMRLLRSLMEQVLFF